MSEPSVFEERWRLLAEHPDPTVKKAVTMVEKKIGALRQSRQARFDSYLPQRAPDEPHDRHCQVTRLGPRHFCTCESNRIRRNQQIINAARAGDLEFLDTLGSFEAYKFDQIRTGQNRPWEP